jgi:hypothetical protein
MITSDTFVWEAKGRDGVQMRAYDRFVFTTNSANCLKINPDSRRFVVYEVSSELKGNASYFKGLSGHIADEHARYEFYQLLMRRDIGDVDWINSRPLTKYYDRMVEMNLGPGITSCLTENLTENSLDHANRYGGIKRGRMRHRSS